MLIIIVHYCSWPTLSPTSTPRPISGSQTPPAPSHTVCPTTLPCRYGARCMQHCIGGSLINSSSNSCEPSSCCRSHWCGIGITCIGSNNFVGKILIVVALVFMCRYCISIHILHSQIANYADKKSRIVFGPDLVVLGPHEVCMYIMYSRVCI